MSEIKKGSRVRLAIDSQFIGTVIGEPRELVAEILWSDGVVSHALKSGLILEEES